MPEHFLVQLRSKLDELPQSERRVAAYVLETPEEAMRLSLTKLAEASGVSQPTVLRCFRRLGCNNLQDFRLKMAEAEAIGLTATHAGIEPGSPIDDIVGRVLDFSISNLANLRRHIDMKSMQSVVEALIDARSIHFWGNGASGIVAKDAQQKFPLFGVPCLAEADSHQILINANVLSPDDVVVAISNTGRNSVLMPAVDAAKENGATVVLITSNLMSLLGEKADHVLCIPTLENTDVFTPTISRLAALCVIDMLAIAVAQGRDAAAGKKIRVMKEELVRTYRTKDQ